MYSYSSNIIIFVAIIIAVVAMFLRARKHDSDPATKHIQRIIFAAFSTWFFYGMYLSGLTEHVSFAGYITSCICNLMTLYFCFLYSHEHILGTRSNKILRTVILSLIATDSVVLILNVRYKIYFELSGTFGVGDSVFYEVKRLPPFWLHVALMIVMAVLIIACIVKKILCVKNSSRANYIVALVIFSLMTTADVALFIASTRIDASPFFAVMLSAIAFLYQYYYSMRYIVDKTQRMFLDNVESAVFIFNADCKCIYYNTTADVIMKSGGKGVAQIEESMKEWDSKRSISKWEDFRKVQTDVLNVEGRHIQVAFKKLFNKRGSFMGCCVFLDDMTAEHDKMLRQHFLAYHDELTGLYNKRHFCESVSSHINNNEDKDYLIIVVDIQHFKLVNDLLGREEGDKVLRNLAFELKGELPDTAKYGRIGGDRFAICVEKDWYSDEKFSRLVENALLIKEHEDFPLYSGIGVYGIHDRLMPVDSMIDRAVMALSSAKGQYSTTLAHYDDKFREGLMEEREIVRALPEAIESGQITVFLQPQISEKTGKAYGAEALVRWIHPEKGVIPPGMFIPQLERNGQIFKLDYCVWDKACRVLKDWKDRGITDIALSVNISPRDFFYCDVYEVFDELIKKYDLEPDMLRLEITETAIMNDFEAQKALIRRLQDSGFIIEMDDFGSGYSSLNMLKDLVVDVIKMDMGFLEKSNDDERAKAIMEIIIELARKLALPVIAEGVETKDQLEFLSRIGCELYQGYYFDKPLPIEEFEDKYIK